MDKHNHTKLIVKVLAIGLLIAVLSYLFHPEIGQFSLMVNGQPIPQPLAKLAAIPTFLALIVITALLIMLLFFGVGLLVFFAVFFIALAICFVLAPYFWPILAIILLVIALMSYGQRDKPDT
jgi:hypothetical protein